MEILPLSKTSITDFLFCPWYLYAIRILKRQKLVGIAAMNGINAHDLLAKIITGAIVWDEALNSAANEEVKNLLVLANTWWSLTKLMQQYRDGSLLVEETVYATKTGRRVKTRRSALITAIVDLATSDGSIVYLDDWKTGKWEQDSQLERDIYAGIAARAMFPDAQKIVFTLRFVRTGNVLQSTYQFSQSGNVVIVTSPSLDTRTYMSDGNPFLQEMIEMSHEIAQAQPIPRHGAHCKKHYGQPCQFYADGTCPYWAEKLKES